MRRLALALAALSLLATCVVASARTPGASTGAVARPCLAALRTPLLTHLPPLFCVNSRADLATMVALSGSPVATQLASAVRTSMATATNDSSGGAAADNCWPSDATVAVSWPDLDGDGGDDVVQVTYSGCVGHMRATWRVLDSSTGRPGWRGTVTGFFPFLLSGRFGIPARPGVLTEDYNPTWENAAGNDRAYHGRALSLTAFSGTGHRQWTFHVNADVQNGNDFTAPSYPEFGAVISGSATDTMYGLITQSSSDPATGPVAGKSTTTTTFVDGRTGHVSTDPTVTDGPTTAVAPSLVGDIDHDGHDDYLLAGGFDVSPPVTIANEPPDEHRLYVDAYSGRTRTKTWSQTYDENPQALAFMTVRDLTGDKVPEITGIVFSGLDGIRSVLLDGANGKLLADAPGFPVILVHLGNGPRMLGIGSLVTTDQSATATLDGYDASGSSRRIASVTVAQPPGNSSFVESDWLEYGDVNGDGDGDIGVTLSASNGSATNHASAMIGSDGSLHHAPLVDRPNGWAPLGDSIRGKATQLVRTRQVSKHEIALDIAEGFTPHIVMTVTVTARGLEGMFVSVVHGSHPSARCGNLVMSISQAKPAAVVAGLLDTRNGRIRWWRQLFGRRSPLSVETTSREGC